MKHRFIPAILTAIVVAGTFACPIIAEEPKRESAGPGPVLVPFDFYPRHREELRLNEDQVREMQRLAEGMRDSGQKLEAERRERTKAFQELMAQSPIDSEKAMDRFQAVLKAENEMKVLQLRSGIAMRNALTSEQAAKLQPLAQKERASQGGQNPAEIREMFQQVKEEIRKRSEGEPPREVVERMEQIERAARQGRMGEAKGQLEAMLRHLRNEPGSHPSADGKPTGDAQRAEREQQMRAIKEKIEHTDDPEQRERLQQQMRKLSGGKEHERSASPSDAPKEGLEKRMREIGAAAKRTDDPELREQLHGALKGLREAAESGNHEAVEKIMRAIEPALRKAAGGSDKGKE